jgi:hypothetical protein
LAAVVLALVLHRQHSISSQPYPPFRRWPIVGLGCAGPPYPSMRMDLASASARSAARAAVLASWRAVSARNFAPMIRPSHITSRVLVLMDGNYSSPKHVSNPRDLAACRACAALPWSIASFRSCQR